MIRTARLHGTLQKFLVAVDGSECARHALEHAIKLAKEHGQIELHLLTVHPEPVIYGEIEVYVGKKKMEELQRLHSMDILQPAIDTAKSAQVPFTSEIIAGETASMIAQRAEKLGCTGIIMGTRGMGTIGNLVMGSVAAKVVHLTSLPVTLVR